MLRTVQNLIVAVVIGLVVSGVALFIAAAFSMGMALQEPAVVFPILILGPVLSLVTLAVLTHKAYHAGISHLKTTQVNSERESSPPSNLFRFFGGVFLSLPLFLVVIMVENLFPGELRSDVFGPYYTHPFRPLSGLALCLLGLATGAFLWNRFKMRHCAAGLSLGSVALGFFLIFAI